MNDLTFAILGCGMRGQTFARYIKEHPDAGRVVAIAEPIAHRRDLVAKQHDVPPPMQFNRWEELLARPKLADIVLVTLPDRQHAAAAIAALDLGYDMLLEKPMACTLADCVAIDTACRRNNRIVSICHSLRYNRTYAKIKQLLCDGVIGEIVSIDQLEAVDPTHQAHSFVRGNYGNESRSSFMLLAKSCHDMDVICYLVDRDCMRVSSFGSLSHFTHANKPAGAPHRCINGCPVEKECPYSAIKHYSDGNGYGRWIGLELFTDAQRQDFLRTSPYGVCVYDTDNDAVDHQVVNFEFAGGVTGTFTMTAFAVGGRQIRISGTHGYIESRIDENSIELCRYWDTDGRNYKRETIKVPEQAGTHGGGDDNVMDCLIRAVREQNPALVLTGTGESLRTHRVAFAAERARRECRVVTVN